jgi:hypothetical protein
VALRTSLTAFTLLGVTVLDCQVKDQAEELCTDAQRILVHVQTSIKCCAVGG